MVNKQPAHQHLPLSIFLFSFLFFALVMWCAPYSSDDLEFAALEYGTLGEYMTYILQYGNGRVLGNTFSILLSHSKVLCVLGKALLLSSGLVLLCNLLELRSPGGYLAAFLLYVMIDPSVFGEVYVWTSGFSNYFPPIWITLAIVFLLKQYPNLQSRFLRLTVCVLVLLLGFAGQLFIEHSSGINLLLAMYFTLRSLQKDKETRLPCLIWLLATAAGMAAMLLVPKLFYIPGNHTETYRSVSTGSLTGLLFTCAKNAIQLCGHYFGVCLLPVCFGALCTVFLTQDRRTEKGNKLLFSLAGISTIYLLASISLTAANYLGKGALIQHAIDCIFTLIPLLVWILAALRLPRGGLRESVLFCLGFSIIAIGPLLIVTPIPPRVIYQSYLFILSAAILCFRPLLSRLSARGCQYALFAARTVCLLLVLVIGSVFLSIRFMANVRDQHIRQEVEAGAKEITIFRLPYEYTTWDHLWSQHYAYGTDEEVTFTVINFDQWMHNIY